MRYWLYCEDRLVGPCEREEIPAVEGFDADTLVCPEEQPGAYPRQWRRAAQVPELSLLLLPEQVRPGASREAGWGPLLPPEPTLTDVAEVNSLQEKVRLIANAVHLLRDQMAEQKARTAELSDELERKAQTLRETQLKLGQAEERLKELDPLRQDAARLQEGLQAVQARLAELDALRERQDGLSRRLGDLELVSGRIEKGEDRLVELEKSFLKAREEAAAALSKAVGQLLSEIMAVSASRQAAAGLPSQAAPAPAPPAAPAPAEAPKPPAPKADAGEFGLDTLDLFGEEGGKGDLL